MPVDTTAAKGSVRFNKVNGRLQFTVPQGTKLQDALKAVSKIDVSKLGRLPRGCQACLSGLPFDIREDFEEIMNVNIGR